VTFALDLKEADGTTLLTLTNPCVSKEARDPMVNYRAAGENMAWDRLPELLARS
jgi:hypothetical protein